MFDGQVHNSYEYDTKMAPSVSTVKRLSDVYLSNVYLLFKGLNQWFFFILVLLYFRYLTSNLLVVKIVHIINLLFN